MDRSILKKRRKQLGLTQQQIADTIGVQKPTYQRYESGVIKRIDTLTIEKLSNALKTTPEFLMGWVSDVDIGNTYGLNVLENEMVQIPILRSVSANQNILANNNMNGYEPVQKSFLKLNSEYFFLSVKGDSMYPIILENDMVLIQKQTNVESGSYGVIIVDGEEGFIKKVVYRDGSIELHSENPYYPVRIYKGSAIETVYIIGKVVEIRRKL